MIVVVFLFFLAENMEKTLIALEVNVATRCDEHFGVYINY